MPTLRTLLNEMKNDCLSCSDDQPKSERGREADPPATFKVDPPTQPTSGPDFKHPLIPTLHSIPKIIMLERRSGTNFLRIHPSFEVIPQQAGPPAPASELRFIWLVSHQPLDADGAEWQLHADADHSIRPQGEAGAPDHDVFLKLKLSEDQNDGLHDDGADTQHHVSISFTPRYGPQLRNGPASISYGSFVHPARVTDRAIQLTCACLSVAQTMYQSLRPSKPWLSDIDHAAASCHTLTALFTTLGNSLLLSSQPAYSCGPPGVVHAWRMACAEGRGAHGTARALSRGFPALWVQSQTPGTQLQ
ncbi:hypothetical protein MVEN_01556500 [Mycena venus]|uniref:Uncharacterized protein n=1 Tax=Mycena venus TaxID=2733690 RepID=A0A8H7CRD6_9AGAR|nr:hypothetical protein MVEN_01556500 [Mycena venus]